MKRVNCYALLVVMLVTGGATWAIETKSGDINGAPADSLDREKEDSEIGLDGVGFICEFGRSDGASSFTDNNLYFNCMKTHAQNANYGATYWAGGNAIEIAQDDGNGMAGDEIPGLCHFEKSPEIDYVSVKHTTTQDDTVAKIHSFNTSPYGRGSTIFVEINEDKILDLTDVNTNDNIQSLLFQALDGDSRYGYTVSQNGRFVIIHGIDDNDIWQVGIGSTDLFIYRTMVALEPDTADTEVSYCDNALP